MLNLVESRKLSLVFDSMCCDAIETAVANALGDARIFDSGIGAGRSLELYLEDQFERLKTGRAIRAFMVIDTVCGREQTWSGIVNAQPLAGSGYARFEFFVVGAEVRMKIGHVKPRYVG